MAKENTSLRSRMAAMKKGEVLVLKAEDYPSSTIRNYASDIGFRFRRKITVSIDREAHTFNVKRLS